jgi:hypothetical protein
MTKFRRKEKIILLYGPRKKWSRKTELDVVGVAYSFFFVVAGGRFMRNGNLFHLYVVKKVDFLEIMQVLIN